jgi:hypothetical protein
MQTPIERTARRRASIRLLMAAVFALPVSARAGLLFHRDRGARLDPGVSPQSAAYDAPIPGVRPPGCGDRGHARSVGAHHDPNRVLTGLHRYPCLGGPIPAPPYEDCLYPTGPHPWQR